jgi:hypothetical protein
VVLVTPPASALCKPCTPAAPALVMTSLQPPVIYSIDVCDSESAAVLGRASALFWLSPPRGCWGRRLCCKDR